VKYKPAAFMDIFFLPCHHKGKMIAVRKQEEDSLVLLAKKDVHLFKFAIKLFHLHQ